MPLNESRGGEPRERWPREFDIQGVPRDNRLRERLLREYQEYGVQTMPVEHLPINKFVTDVSDPATSARPDTKNIKPYNPNDPKNEFPKMLYSEEFDEAIERRRAQIAQHNRTLRDPLQCRQLPDRVRLTKVVASKAEEREYLAKGYGLKPPPPLDVDEFASIDSAFLSESERKAKAALGIKEVPDVAAKPTLTIEMIISLNGMSKDDLVRTAKEEYGVSLAPEATKLDILKAIEAAAR
jgi:hypothetical protein